MVTVSQVAALIFNCPFVVADSNDPAQAMSDWVRVLTFRDYNTRVVIFGVAVLGGASGLIGSFTLLRKRALMGDALAHASLPGIVIAFMVVSAFGGEGKSLPVLLLGATISGLIGMGAILLIRNQTRLKEDAALGIVLSVFFGMGMSLLTIVPGTANVAGLKDFIYGKTATLLASDATWIAIASLIVIVLSSLLFKELKLLCFDEGYAGSRGYPVVALDIALMSMVVLVTIVGLRAVGLILMVALLVIPAAAARFWTESMWKMMLWSTLLGSVSSVVGGLASALLPDLPSGAMIVLVCSGFFFVSMMVGKRRGVLIRYARRWRLNRRIDRQHLLRAMYEQLEHRTQGSADAAQSIDSAATKRKRNTLIPIDDLLAMRSWSKRRLNRALHCAEDDELLRLRGTKCKLTQAGYAEAARLTRQHRLWEMYLIAYADVATANVDRDADRIEHVLAPEVIDQLEDLLDEQGLTIAVPQSPHVLAEQNDAERDLDNPLMQRGAEQ